MQIVIDIDVGVYCLLKYFEKALRLNDKKDGNGDVKTALMRAVINGTLLPKGHGVLKDADAMINKLCTSESSEFFGSVACAEIMDFINDEKPIIEADKEN